MHLSYSAIDLWRKCPFAFKLKKIDNINLFGGSIHSCFGSAVHDTIKNILLEQIADSQIDDHFKNYFKNELKLISQTKKEEIFKNENTKETLRHMSTSGAYLCRQSIKFLLQKFPNYKIIQVEQEFNEPILIKSDADYDFKGIIDLIIQTPDGIYHVLDWKSCSWGWKAEKKTSKWVTYQLAYYKHYFSLQNNIDLSNVHCHFGLIKRTAKKDNIEIFETSIGPRKIKNALKIINNLIYNTEKGHFPKNRLSCKYCDYHRTQ